MSNTSRINYLTNLVKTVSDNFDKITENESNATYSDIAKTFMAASVVSDVHAQHKRIVSQIVVNKLVNLIQLSIPETTGLDYQVTPMILAGLNIPSNGGMIDKALYAAAKGDLSDAEYLKISTDFVTAQRSDVASLQIEGLTDPMDEVMELLLTNETAHVISAFEIEVQLTNAALDSTNIAVRKLARCAQMARGSCDEMPVTTVKLAIPIRLLEHPVAIPELHDYLMVTEDHATEMVESILEDHPEMLEELNQNLEIQFNMIDSVIENNAQVDTTPEFNLDNLSPEQRAAFNNAVNTMINGGTIQ